MSTEKPRMPYVWLCLVLVLFSRAVRGGARLLD